MSEAHEEGGPHEEGTPHDRGARMAGRVAAALLTAGVRSPLPLEAHERAMAVRERALSDDHDPAFLHPGRTLVILLQDLEVTDPEVLAAGALLESRTPHLRADPGGLPAVAARLSRVPILPWGATDANGAEADWLEEAVLEEEWVAQVALAEALDHLRHAHLWTDAELARGAARLARVTLHPLAQRVGGIMERRYAWWVRRVGKALEVR